MNIEKYSKVAPQSYTGEIPKLLYELFKQNNFSTILDAGCGDGALIYSIIRQKLAKNGKITAIDLSKNRIKLVKKISSKIIAKVDSAETLKTVKPQSVELLITTQVIEHVNDRLMAKTMARVVKKGSIVYLSTVFKKWYGWYFYKNDIGWVIDPTHLREYTKDSQLINILKEDFYIAINKKTLQWFPLIDFVAKRISSLQKKRDNLAWKIIRSVRIPILGYYNWELILVKK